MSFILFLQSVFFYNSYASISIYSLFFFLIEGGDSR